MKFTCLSKGKGYHFPPSYILDVSGFRILIDCPIDLSALTIFSPVPIETVMRGGGSSSKQPNDHGPIEGKDLICAEPWYKVSSSMFLWNVASIDVVLVCSPMGFLGLPFLTQTKDFSAKIYATEATARLGQLLLEDLVSMHMEFKQYYGPDKSSFPQWLRWEELETLPHALRDIAAGKDGIEVGGWMPIYSAIDAKDCMKRIHTLKFAEETCYNGALVMKAFSSGLEIGSCNWTITDAKRKIAFLSSSVFVSTHAMSFQYDTLQGNDLLLYTDFTSLNGTRNSEMNTNQFDDVPDKLSDFSSKKESVSDLLKSEDTVAEMEKLAYICSCSIDSLKAGGSVLIPIGRLGIVLQLLEQMSLFLELSALEVPIYIISSVAEELLAFTNVIPEWLCEQRQEKLFFGEPLFGHIKLLKDKKLHLFPAIYSQDLLKIWQEPCIVFAPHWSLRLGSVPHLLKHWSKDKNSLLVMEEGLDAEIALSPFKPMTMKVLQCSFLSGIGLHNIQPLLKILQPKFVLSPEGLLQKISLGDAPSSSFIHYAENQTLRIPSIKDCAHLEIATDLSSQFHLKKLKYRNIHVTRLKGDLSMSHGQHRLRTGDNSGETSSMIPMLLCGSLDSKMLLTALQNMGLIGHVERPTETEGENTYLVRQEFNRFDELEKNSQEFQEAMWLSKGDTEKKVSRNGLVAVAVDKDKCSQHALKWAIDNLLTKDQTVVLIHVLQRAAPSNTTWSYAYAHVTDITNPAIAAHKKQLEKQTRDLFLTFRCFCTRKDINCLDITLEDTDVVKALTEYASFAAIEILVLGAPSRNGFLRKFKISDVPNSVSKAAPDFCTVYVISKGKISSVRNPSRPAPFTSPLLTYIQKPVNIEPRLSTSSSNRNSFSHKDKVLIYKAPSPKRESARGKEIPGISWSQFSESENDLSYISSARPSVDHMSNSPYDIMDVARTPRMSVSSDQSFGSVRNGARVHEFSSLNDFSAVSIESGRTSLSSSAEEAEAEMRRLKLELKQTMEMYSTACKEALTAKQKAMELHRWRLDEEKRLEEARLAEEAALAMAEKERAKCRAAIEKAEAHQKIAELEAQRRVNAEMKALRESEEMKKTMNSMGQNDLRYRRYTIEEIESATEFFSDSLKIGEGGYGPVYKCYLDHTPVAVKVLRPDAAQGRSQFQQEVEVLSCIRHPNMVLLLGACPEYGCLVYEYMAKGSLDDCLFQRGKAAALSWQIRFRIAAEIATGLLFLHQTKPEPLVHRDLKPGNILLDHNYVSKISDVGLARLVPPSVADNVTQYRMTSTAGTFCYIDPEYQQTGMLGVKSDVYSLGILLLQLITGKSPMGLTHHVEKSIENGTFAQMLDPDVPDWPVEEAMNFAKLSLQCSELRRKDRPDLGEVVLPELTRLKFLAEENMPMVWGGSRGPSPYPSKVSISQDSVPVLRRSVGYSS